MAGGRRTDGGLPTMSPVTEAIGITRNHTQLHTCMYRPQTHSVVKSFLVCFSMGEAVDRIPHFR
jgi:hypothetical protein